MRVAMRVALFPTCLVDQMWPSVGEATVRLLRRVGCEVVFDPGVTCCGQPAFNTGYRAQARQVAAGTVQRLLDLRADAIVAPSGSCTAMFHHLPELWPEGDPWRARARELAGQIHELGTFLVRGLGKTDVGARFDGRITWHDAYHGLRELGIKDEPRQLIHAVNGAELVEMPGAENCCGFGGTFAIKHADISVAILDQKLSALEQLDVKAVVSGDVSCLMQIGGRLARTGSPIRAMHLAELLAGAEAPA